MKKIISLILAVCILPQISAIAAPVYSDNVRELLAELSIMQGDPDGNMRYDDLVSRAECTKMVVATSSFRDSVASGSKTSPFSDVPYTHWASPYVTVGVKNGLLKGYLDATFRPANHVLYEEAVTMFLRVLGYTDQDFGSSWPDGQMGIAKNIGLLDDIERNVGEKLTRRDMAKLAYNTLTGKAKGTQNTYLQTFNRTIVDDVVLISTINEDPSIPDGKVFTSSGTYNYANTLNLANLGKRGSLVLRNGDTVVSFIPTGVGNGGEEEMVYSVLGNGIVTYKDGSFRQIDVDSDTVFYKDSQKVASQSALSSLKMGDIVRVSYKSNNKIDYISCFKGTTIGPITVKSSLWYNSFSGGDTVSVMRDGVKATVSDVKVNDVVYYMEKLNIALVYSKKVTGIYEAASPNKDAPTSVTVSGVTYQLEGVDAFSKLSSSGTFNYGDSLTLMLGKDGAVADVMTSANGDIKVYGFLQEVGNKVTSVSGSDVTKPYIKVVLPSGDVSEFITDKNYSSIKNSVVSIKLEDGVAKASKLSQNHGVYGKFQWDKKKLGKSDLADDVKIVEVSTIVASENSVFASVYPQRLDGITLSDTDILYAEKTSDGKIKSLILSDVTGDMHTYGIVTKATSMSDDRSISGSYEYMTKGNTVSFSTNGTAYSVEAGQAVRIESDGRSVVSMTPLSKITGRGNVEISGAYVTIGEKSYQMSDKVEIYLKKTPDSSVFNMITQDEFDELKDEYQVALYTDSSSVGGRVRIIVLS